MRTEVRPGRGWLARRFPIWRQTLGFSLIETTIILSASTVMATTAAPSIMDYLAQARGIKVSGDTQVLTTAVARMLFDVSTIKVESRGLAPGLLVGPGEVAAWAGAEAQGWAGAVDGRRVQFLADHLVTNKAGYPLREGVGFAKGWSGPYVDFVPVDPWGHRYGVNIGVSGTRRALVILSAGPDGLVETPFNLTVFKRGGDDILGLLGSGR